MATQLGRRVALARRPVDVLPQPSSPQSAARVAIAPDQLAPGQTLQLPANVAPFALGGSCFTRRCSSSSLGKRSQLRQYALTGRTDAEKLGVDLRHDAHRAVYRGLACSREAEADGAPVVGIGLARHQPACLQRTQHF